MGRNESVPIVITCLTALLPTVSERPALAQGVIRDSVGAVSSGRGGTNIAHSDNLMVILDNPAGLANIFEEERLDIGLDTLLTDLHYTDPQNDAHAKVVPFPLPTLGYAKKSADPSLVYGIGVFAPAGFGATYRLQHVLYGKREYSSLGALIKVLPAAAWQVNDRLSVGGTFGLAASHAALSMPFNFQTGLFAGVPANIDLKATGFAPAWSVGGQYKLSEKTTAGLSFLSETRFRLRGDAKADVSGIGLPLLKAAYDTEIDLVWPGSVGAGITHRLNHQHRLSGDILWFDWSHAFDKLDLKLTDGSNPLFNALLGPKVRDTLPLDWHDSIAYRFGYEYFPTPKDALRLGYVFHRNPIPDATLCPLLAGTLEHAVTLGYGHQWKEWRIDIAYQYSWGATNRVSRSRIVGGDFDNSSMSAEAQWLGISFSRSF